MRRPGFSDCAARISPTTDASPTSAPRLRPGVDRPLRHRHQPRPGEPLVAQPGAQRAEQPPPPPPARGRTAARRTTAGSGRHSTSSGAGVPAATAAASRAGPA